MSPLSQRGHPLFATVYDGMTRPLEEGRLGEHRERLLSPLTDTVLGWPPSCPRHTRRSSWTPPPQSRCRTPTPASTPLSIH